MRFTENQKAQLTSAFLELFRVPIEKLSIKLWDQLFEKFGSNSNLAKIYFNYEEKNCEKYSLEEAIRWFKNNINSEEKYKAGIYKEEETRERLIRLHLFFIDENKALIGHNHVHLFVNTFELDQNLISLFGVKSLVIIN